MKKIKVLQFPIAASKGGITQYVLQNWKFIDRECFQFDFATMSKSLDFAQELEEQGSRVFYISCYAEENERRFVEEFREIINKGKYDIVHLHTKQWKSFLVEKIAKEEGVKKIIVHAHSSGIDTKEEEKRIYEQALHEKVRGELTEQIATDYWTCSQKASEFLYGDRISEDKIIFMKNAIDLRKFSFDMQIRKCYRKELNVEDKYVIGSVGRLAYPKNQEFLLEVFKQITDDRDDCVLLLVGTGEKEKELKRYVNENGLQDKVIFLGRRDDVASLLQAMDIFVLPSKFEGLPIGLIEAQAAGLKCVCSDVITDEVILTPNVIKLPLNSEEWTEAIENQLCLYDRKDEVGILTEKGYNILTQIKKIENAYRE